MKKLLLSLIALLCITFSVDAQSKTQNGLNLTPRDTLMLQYMDTYVSQLREPRYQLFKTQNKWIFLKLDTMTGQLWMVQYSLENNAGEFALDTSKRISEYFDEPICGRFTLYSTDNMFNFILLDQIDGRCWQVQWHTEPDKVGVWRIY